ncbi:MAG: GspH/FimT family pseudopilin [Aquabacterium sp.]
MFRSAPIFRQRSASSGFTLIELMVTVTILAILLALGVPSLTEMMRDKAANASAEALAADLRLARMEAVKRGQQVSLCGVVLKTPAGGGAPQYECMTTQNGAWANGWMIIPVGSNTPTKVQEPHLGIDTIKLDSTDQYIFNPTGMLQGGGRSSIVVKSSTSSGSARVVCINSAGKARIAKGETC